MSLMSMTGFGKASIERDGLQLEVEAKSVNNRFLDVVCKLPSQYSSLEHELSKNIRAQLRRGRIEIFVNRKDSREGSVAISFNDALFQSYLTVIDDALDRANIPPQDDRRWAALVDVLKRREVVEVTYTGVDDASEGDLLRQVVASAVVDLISMRTAEGQTLEKELTRLLKDFEKSVASISEARNDMVQVFRERLTTRLEKLKKEITIEESRLAQEVAILAERVDITEELARLDSHCKQFRSFVKNDDSGRKLEFLLQEMGREVNTVGSKAQSSDIANHVIEAKSLLEKMREQVLNIE